MQGFEYKYQIICAQPGERFTESPKGDEFENCDQLCGEDPFPTTTTTTTFVKVDGCKQWCAGNSHAWSSKCSWKNCKRCGQCIQEAEGCKTWCAENSHDWTSKCTWKSCNQCAECQSEQEPKNCKKWCP